MNGRVLLDTNIVIGLFAKDESILFHLSQTAHIFIPAIVLGELYFGAFKSAHPDNNVRAIEQLITARAVLICDGITASHYGRIKKALRDKGRPLPENDIWIAAIGQQHALKVITRDHHFNEIDDLIVEAW